MPTNNNDIAATLSVLDVFCEGQIDGDVVQNRQISVVDRENTVYSKLNFSSEPYCENCADSYIRKPESAWRKVEKIKIKDF